MKRLSFAVLLFALVVLALACGEDAEEASPSLGAASQTPPLAKLTFLAGFKPQANLPFVGAYVAQEKGFFAEQNLEVKIEHVTQPGEAFRLLLADEVQITTADAAVVLERRAGDPSLPITAIALIGQKGQQAFAVLANSGIRSPKDWEGKTVGYKGSRPTPDYLAVLEATGANRDKVNEVRIGFDIRLLTEGRVDVFPLFLSNEPYAIKSLGFDVRLFEASDYGVPTLGLTYVATDNYIRDQPGVVRRFLKAALNGIYWANDHRDEALEIIMKYAPNEDRNHQRFMLETELGSAFVGHARTNGVGWMTSEQWRDLHDMLLKYEAISRPLSDPNAAFTDRFVREIYQGGRLIWP